MLYENHKNILGHQRAMEPDVISEQGEQRNISDRPDRKRFTRKKLCLLLVPVFVILTLLLFYIVNIYHTPDLNELLARAKLAKVPESIQNLQIDTCPCMDNDGRAVLNTSEMLVRFEAEPNDIDKFINNSPGIDKNRFRPLVPLPDSDEIPTWWPTDGSSGRMYDFERYKREYITGMVAVYDDSNTVRLWALYIVNPQLYNMKNDIEDMHDAFEDFLDDMLHEVQDVFEDLFRN